MNKMLSILIFCLPCFRASAQILNGDFEDWFTDGAGHTRLNNWQHLDFGIANTGFMATWEVNDAEHGSHALKLSRWYSYRSDWVMQKVSVASKPGILTGHYKYTDNQLMSPYDIDTALVSIWLTVWNSISSKCDTVGTGRSLLMASSTYIPFTCPISYTDTRMPDSMIIFIKPSVWFNNAVFCAAGNCSFLTIDNLSLAASSEVEYIDRQPEVSAYFSTSYNELTIVATNEINEVVFYNTIGQMICKGRYNNEEVKLNTAALPGGIYMMIVGDDTGKKTVKKISKR